MFPSRTWPLLCTECRKRGTFTVASGPHGFCRPHYWRAEASGLDMAGWWRRWYLRSRDGRGNTRNKIPAVLDPAYELRDCPACGDIIQPWREWIWRRGERVNRWCLPSGYAKRQTCGKVRCVAALKPRAAGGHFIVEGEAHDPKGNTRNSVHAR